jgi:hypothetical protein
MYVIQDKNVVWGQSVELEQQGSSVLEEHYKSPACSFNVELPAHHLQCSNLELVHDHQWLAVLSVIVYYKQEWNKNGMKCG